ncbi:golgin family A protein [Trema orientale]|uniref:Golgin family A protein n=1 Tax=Trema orientale TaxID=63057 RepID=A0A2P5CW42_TREOI|nr:golgin family A protein [Trema orientale]
MSCPNPNPNTEESTKCKIRKRNCSSSSSSSLVRKYRFKRAILMGKRGGSTTPAAPMWETASPAPVSMADAGAGGGGGRGKEAVSVSARKLAATLWEMNHSPNCKEKKKEGQAKDKFPKLPSSQSASLPPHLSDPSYAPICDRRREGHGHGHGGGGGHGHQRTMSAVAQKFQLTDYYLGGLDSLSTATLMEVQDPSRGKTHHRRCVNGVKTRLKEVSSGLATSKELVKLLNHVWGLEEQRSLSTSLFSALRFELDRAFIQVDRFFREQRSNRSELECLMKHFAEEKAAWKSKERERIRGAISCMAEELKAEKKLRRQTERLNKKIGSELADTKASLSKASKELEREKRAKEILEQVCDELARGIGEDRAQVEELKRESEKVREEVEKERQMLQLADVLREERVQMKLSEAKYQFEEKNAAVEQLRNELEAYLISKMGREDGELGSPKFEKIKELEAYLKEINFGSAQKAEKENGGKLEKGGGEEEQEGDDSVDSDLHSIELSMDNKNRSYKWSYACGDEINEEEDDDDGEDSKRISVDRDFKGRKSISEKIQWGSICLNKSTRDLELDFGNKSQGRSDVVSQAKKQEFEDELKRYISVKGLADHILSGSELVPIPGFTSPTRKWG